MSGNVMAPFNNIARSLIPPSLLLMSLPLAILACITTILAVAILLLRVTIIYIELALIVIPYYLLSSKPVVLIPRLSSSSSSLSQSNPIRRKARRGSTSSLSPTDTTRLLKAVSGLGLNQSIGVGRDYEGLGGWRLDETFDDEGSWTGLNSRLDLPAHHARNHHRSLTSESLPLVGKLSRSYSEEMTMNTSRVRTPSRDATSGSGEGYFPLEIGMPRRPKERRR